MPFLPTSPLGWFKLAGIAGALLAVWLTYSGISNWLADNEAARLADAKTISDQKADIDRLNSEVAAAAADLKKARETFAANISKLENDLKVVTAARDAAVRRAKAFDRAKDEVANAPDVQDRPASPLLVRSVTSVRGLLRGRSPTAEDRMAGEDRGSRAPNQPGAVR